MAMSHKVSTLLKNQNILSSKVSLKLTADSDKINIKINKSKKTKKILSIMICRSKIILKTHLNKQEFLIIKNKDRIKSTKLTKKSQVKVKSSQNLKINKRMKNKNYKALKISNSQLLMPINC